MAERSLEPDFPDSLEAHNNSRYAHITRNLRGEPPMPVDTDRLSVLLFLRNISQGAAEKAVTDAFKNDTRSLDLYDFGESQKIIVGNNEALQLLTDYDWVIRLASNLSKGFEIQDLYQSLPTDWNWVYRQLQAIFNLPADERNQKRLNHATVEWAARWIMVRCRYMQNIIRADWKTRDWYGSDRYSFSGSYLAHTPDLLFDSLIPAYTKSPFVPPRAVAIETRGPETWSDNINVIYEHTYQWRRDDVRDLDNIINGGAVPQNTVDIFQWLVDYHNRYLLWRRTVLEICRRYRWTEIRILQRWLYRVDAGFQEFLVYFRRLLKHQRRYSGLKQSTWIKTRFCILHVNALVRFCKINYVQPVDDDYHRSIGSPAHFPNFHLSIYGDAVQDGRHNFPRLQPEARQPNDPDPPGFRARLPGAREGAAGPRMTGGLRGVAGIGGFGGLNGSRVVLDHDFSDVDSDPEDSRRPVCIFHTLSFLSRNSLVHDQRQDLGHIWIRISSRQVL
ncbi:hypothetical protein F4818DRAFT_228380 [Hypoxylon cercidicola]|nr:hypothetical protein F4818DRAFT_228380 [Hypoxylon cercidicola]